MLPSTALIRKSAIPVNSVFGIRFHLRRLGIFSRMSRETSCLYVDLATAYNRSHEDAVRLTRVDSTVQLGRRIAMIDRLWRADKKFHSEHGDKVDEVQAPLVVTSSEEHLLAARTGQARAHLKRASQISDERRSIRSWRCVPQLPFLAAAHVVAA